MHDLPTGLLLLAFARDVLINELMPLLPEERRPDAIRVARCMAIAAREAEAWVESEQAMLREIELLYGRGTDLRLLARELRIGAFENSPDREVSARAILWRLTVAKLRQSNPEFLAANGFD